MSGLLKRPTWSTIPLTIRGLGLCPASAAALAPAIGRANCVPFHTHKAFSVTCLLTMDARLASGAHASTSMHGTTTLGHHALRTRCQRRHYAALACHWGLAGSATPSSGPSTRCIASSSSGGRMHVLTSYTQAAPHVSARHARSCVAAAAATQATGPAQTPAGGGGVQLPEEEQLQPDLPSAEFSRVRKAVYISSAVDLKGCPPERYPEFAVIGRSNVGKSSLINMLTSSAGLAKVSKEPGKTKTINHFLINDAWYLVDLPGYGYAKQGRQRRLDWLDFTRDYFLKRSKLVAVLLLVDSSIPPQNVDLDCANWLGEAEVPFAIVFTKADNAKKKGGPTPAQNMAAFKRQLLQEWEALPAVFVTSSRIGQGRTEVLQYLASLRRLEEAQG